MLSGEPVSHWVEALKDRKVQTRRDAAKILGQAGPDGQEAVAALEQLLKKPSEDPLARYNAAVSIQQITKDPGRAVPGLVTMLNSTKPDARFRGALALKQIGPAAAPAVPKLKKIVDAYSQRNYADLSYDEQLLLATAREALSKIEPADTP